MKKIIILIIVLCLLSFVEFSCFSAQVDNYKNIWDNWSNYERYVYLWGFIDGLKEGNLASYSLLINPDYKYHNYDPSSPDYYFNKKKDSGDEFKIPERWLKEMAMTEAMEGCSETAIKTIKEIIKNEKEEESNIEFEIIKIINDFGKTATIEVIRDITTDLYKDPANSYIYFTDMCSLAFWKLKGKNIEPTLIELRKFAADIIKNR